jgi:hypothetical protein
MVRLKVVGRWDVYRLNCAKKRKLMVHSRREGRPGDGSAG